MMPILPGGQVQRILVDEVEDQHRAAHVAEQVGGPGARGDAAQVPVREDVPDPRPSLLPHARALAGRRIVRLRTDLFTPDDADEERGGEVARRVEEDGEGRLDGLDEEAGDRRPGDLRRGARELELRVALDQLVALDDVGQVRLVGDVEEDLERAGEEGHDVDLDEGEPAADERDRDGRQQHRAARGPRR